MQVQHGGSVSFNGKEFKTFEYHQMLKDPSCKQRHGFSYRHKAMFAARFGGFDSKWYAVSDAGQFMQINGRVLVLKADIEAALDNPDTPLTDAGFWGGYWMNPKERYDCLNTKVVRILRRSNLDHYDNKENRSVGS